MTFGCKTFTVEQLMSLGVLEIGDGYRAKNAELGEHGLPFARVANINDGFDFTNVDRFPEENLHRVGNKLSQPADVVFTSKGTVGRFAFVTPSVEQFVYSPQLCFWRSMDPRVLDPLYLYFWMHGPEFLNQVDYLKAQTDMADYVSLRDQRTMSITIPPLPVQLNIAQMLGALEDRISLLRDTNETLESIAQAIFKSWFIDFDPVHAKAAGQEPEGMDAETAALFPSEFADSELGPIPKGWRVEPVKSLCDRIANGGTPSRRNSDFWDGGSIPWFRTGELTDGFLTGSGECITPAALEKTSVKFFPRHTVLMAIYAAPTVGRLGVLTQDGTFNQACTGLVAKPDIQPWFLYQTLFHGRGWFNNRANGAAQQNISKAIVESYPCVVPPPEVLSAYNSVAEHLYASIESNTFRIETLADLRDTLLPRLISGKLRIPEAEELVQEAVS